MLLTAGPRATGQNSPGPRVVGSSAPGAGFLDLLGGCRSCAITNSSLRVTSTTPVACQIDGDYLGLRDDMTFTSVPNALGVVAPPVNMP